MNVWNKMIDTKRVSTIGFLYGLKNSLKCVFIPKLHMEITEIYFKNLVVSQGYIG